MNEKQQEITELLVDKLKKNENSQFQKNVENNIKTILDPNTDIRTFGKKVENLKKIGCMTEYQAEKLLSMKKEYEEAKAEYEKAKENLSSLYEKQFKEEQKKEEQKKEEQKKEEQKKEEQKKEEEIKEKYEGKTTDYEIDTKKIILYCKIKEELQQKTDKQKEMQDELLELKTKINNTEDFNKYIENFNELYEEIELLEEEIKCMEMTLKLI
jgi:hypothetical protein